MPNSCLNAFAGGGEEALVDRFNKLLDPVESKINAKRRHSGRIVMMMNGVISPFGSRCKILQNNLWLFLYYIGIFCHFSFNFIVTIWTEPTVTEFDLHAPFFKDYAKFLRRVPGKLEWNGTQGNTKPSSKQLTFWKLVGLVCQCSSMP